MKRPRRERPARWAPDPVGVVLAGGLGRRIGGSKAVVELGGRPLITYPLEAMCRALGDVAVLAKVDTELPSLPGVAVWLEPTEPRHPLVGIVRALRGAHGRPVLVCAADMPFVTAELIVAIARADTGGGLAVLASGAGGLQPLLGCYRPDALQELARLALDVALRDALAVLDPAPFEVDDPEQLFNVNSPDDLLQAAAMLDRRGRATDAGARPGRWGGPN